MLAGLILGAALVVAVLLFARIAQSAISKDRYFIGVSAIGVFIVGAVVTVVLNSGNSDSGASSTDMARIDAVLRSAGNGQPGMQRTSGIASVPSLLTGLQQRLESDPNDAAGWALLAQSYAFVGQMDHAEEALARAVNLGLDEADLRLRIAKAERSPHAGLSGVALAQALAP